MLESFFKQGIGSLTPGKTNIFWIVRVGLRGLGALGPNPFALDAKLIVEISQRF